MSLLLKNVSLPLAGFTLEVNVEIRSPVTVIFGPSGEGAHGLVEWCDLTTVEAFARVLRRVVEGSCGS